MTTPPEVHVEFTPYFLSVIKKLQKKYPHVSADLQPLVQQLEQGATPGDQVTGVGFTVYKMRLKNSDVAKGKSGGYRVIYYVRTPAFIALLTIYAKTEQADMSAEEIRHWINDLRLS
jgi:mRNA-degrading endonuclease RelE of RelBE toxin-antitoxin system